MDMFLYKGYPLSPTDHYMLCLLDLTSSITYATLQPNFALNSPQPIVRLATIAVVHHLIINANFVRIEDISPKVFTIYFLMNCSDHITEKSQ
ncbi:MAG: hypothetical protein ACJASU_002497 [Cognaticolwellia sp.]|jgi:hypothetical protein